MTKTHPKIQHYSCAFIKDFEHMHPEFRVKRLTLDLLEKEKPLSFELDGNGEYNVIGSRAKCLDNGAINSMVEIARNISYDYEYGFKETGDLRTAKSVGLGYIVMASFMSQLRYKNESRS